MEEIQEQVHDADIKLTASQIVYRELERRQTKELNEKRSELQSVKQELELMDAIGTLGWHTGGEENE